jgi:hypothetical protein
VERETLDVEHASRAIGIPAEELAAARAGYKRASTLDMSRRSGSSGDISRAVADAAEHCDG